jgi:iron complex transport system substrate-binding protein
MKKTVIFMVALMLAIGASVGCAPAAKEAPPVQAPPAAEAPAQDAPADSGFVLADMLGREVMLDGPATSVVALMAADVETLYAIGAGDMLVGRGEYCNYPLEALDVQSVESGNETNIEQIIALAPQLVLMTKLGQNEDQIRQLETAGIKVFVTDAQDIEGTYVAIGLLGRLMGKEAEAEAVISEMKTVLADLQKKAAAAGGEQRTIYFEVSPLEFGLWTAGNETFMNEVAGLLGLRNIFGDVPSWAEISEEQVLERNPDYILTVGMYFGDGPTPIESILSRPGWESITAVKNEAILNLTEDELSRPGPRLALGARILYEFVYN